MRIRHGAGSGTVREHVAAEDEYDLQKRQAEIQEHLAKIRKTIEDSNALMESVNLRIQETDRFLASRGYTREQVLNFRFSDEQREQVNAELVRLGMTPIDFSTPEGFDEKTEQLRQADSAFVDAVPAEPMVDLDERAGKFRMMMNAYRVS